MIRDGIILDRKNPKPNSQPVRTTLKAMTFEDLCKLLDHVNATGEFEYIQHLRDPYALMLLLGVYEKVNLPDVMANPAFYKENLLCQRVWELLKEGNPFKIGPLVEKVSQLGQYYLHLIAEGKNLEGVTVEIALRELSKVRQFEFRDAYHTWVLQPDPEVLSFAVISDYTSNDSHSATQRVTPAVGVPFNLVHVGTDRYDIRYPCAVALFYPDADQIQIHKDLGQWKIFDAMGNDYIINNNWIKICLGALKVDGVFEAYYRPSTGYIYFSDILCLNDVWFHNRPFAERMQFLWHFSPHVLSYMVIDHAYPTHELSQLMVDGAMLMFRNLNRIYCPLYRDNIMVPGLNTTIQAKVKRTPGKNGRFVLQTGDGVNLFTFGTDRIARDDVGKVVDVNQDGVVLQYRFDLKEAQDWDEVAEIWGIEDVNDLEYDEDGKWPKSIRWKRLKE